MRLFDSFDDLLNGSSTMSVLTKVYWVVSDFLNDLC